MIAAADYPLLDVFFTILIFFAWVAWISMVFTVLGDVFRRDDISGWGKAGWSLFIIAVPFLGVLTYVVTQSSNMAARNQARAQANRSEFDEYVRSVAATDGPATQIQTAKELLADGSITDAEFDSIKAKALA